MPASQTMNILESTKIALILAGALALVGCSGGSDNPSSSNVLVQYADSSSCPAPTPPNRLRLSLGPVDAASGVIKLNVKANLGDSVRGVAFQLNFDASVLEFVKFDANPTFQGQGLAQAALLDGSPGKLVVGVSRLGTEAGVTGQVTVGTLTVRRRLESGLSIVSFSNESLADANSTYVSELPACFINGQLTISQP